MKVICPKHKEPLKVENTTLSVLSVPYTVAIGTCPVCNQRYINRKLLFSGSTMKIDGKSYEYLPEMEKEYPPVDIEAALSSKSRITNTQSKNKKNDKFLLPDNPHKPQKRELLPTSPEPIKAEIPKTVQPIETPAIAPPKKKKKKPTTAKQLREQAFKRAEEEREAIEKKRQEIQKNIDKPIVPKSVNLMGSRYNFPYKCPADGIRMATAKSIKVKHEGFDFVLNGVICVKCMAAYVEKLSVEAVLSRRLEKEKAEGKNKPKQEEIVSPTKSAPTTKPYLPSLNTGTINFASPNNTLYVCKGIVACLKKGHRVEAATGVLLNHFNRVIKLNTNYCPECRKFFLGYDEYKRYRKLYHGLMGNIRLANEYFVFNNDSLADESLLHICGYTVNQKDDLRASERQTILKYLIDSEISSKPVIIDYLNFFIGRNGKAAGNEEAVRKWEEDLEWIEKYRMDEQRHFEIMQIVKNR